MENLILEHRKSVIANIQKSFEGDIEKARNVGDIHPNGKWVWTEYAPGKFDWRVIKKNMSVNSTDNKVKKNVDNKSSNYEERYSNLSTYGKKEVDRFIKYILKKRGVEPDDVKLEKKEDGNWRVKRLDGSFVVNVNKYSIGEKASKIIGWYDDKKTK